MVLSFRSWITFAFVASQTGCLNFSIVDLTKDPKNDKNDPHSIQYKISNEKKEDSTAEPTVINFSQTHCLDTGETILIDKVNYNRFTLRKKFNLAFDSDSYFEFEGHTEKVDREKNGKFCVLWSYWWPSKWNDITEVEFYFHVVTKSDELKNRFLFYVEFTVKNGSTSYFFKLATLQGIDKAHDDKIRDTFFLANESCEKDSIERQTFILRGKSQTRKENGDIYAVFLVQRSEEPEINTFIAKRNSESELKKGESKILDKIRCSKDKFEFLLEVPEPNNTKNEIFI